MRTKSILIKDTRTPLAVIHAPAGGKLEPLLVSLESTEIQVHHVNRTADLSLVGLIENKNYGICALDLTKPGVNFSECIDEIDLEFRDAGGPVIAILDGKDDYDEAELVLAGAARVLDISLGPEAIKVILTVEIEEFRHITRLKKELLVRSTAIGHIVTAEFKFSTRREAQGLAALLSMTCPSPMPVSLGLTELLVNGVEHGCLEIGHEEKGLLIEQGILNEEVVNRRSKPEYCDRYVTVKFTREPNKLTFRVKDNGKGFDHKTYVQNEAAHEKKHGRGITMAKGCFDSIEYFGNGNEVVAVHLFGEND